MPAADEVTRFITDELTREQLEADELAADYDLLDSGLVDSLGLVQLISWTGERFEIDLDAIDIHPEQFRTVGTICAFVEEFAPSAR